MPIDEVTQVSIVLGEGHLSFIFLKLYTSNTWAEIITMLDQKCTETKETYFLLVVGA